MRLYNYIRELSMKTGTSISSLGSQEGYEGFSINLDTGEVFEVEIFKGTGMKSLSNNKIENWEIFFQDAKRKSISKEPDTNKPKVALKLFAAIESLVTKFIKKRNPQAMGFSGLGGSKVKLYKLLAQKIVKTGKYKGFYKGSYVGNYEFIRTDLYNKGVKQNPKQIDLWKKME